MAIDERFAAIELDRLDRADNDRVAVPLDEFFDRAIDRRDRVVKYGSLGCERRPGRAAIALLSLDTATAGEDFQSAVIYRPVQLEISPREPLQIAIRA